MLMLHRIRSSRRALITLGVLGGSFLGAIEATIVATAMPTVVEQLGGLSTYSWVFAAYLLTSTVTTPVWGRLSDLHGRRRFYMAALALFLGGSMLCGVAQSMEQLILFRALQGLGAGGLLPLGMTILGEIFSVEERARAQALFAGVWGIASVLGPLAGAVITEGLSWRWVFFFNVPFGVVAGMLVRANLVDAPRDERPSVDYVGALLLMATVSALMIALNQSSGEAASLTPAWTRALYGVSAVLGLAFVVSQRRVAEPILPLGVLASRLVAVSTLCSMLVGIAMFGALSFVPLFVQGALGRTPREAGAVLMPLLLGWVLMSAVTGRLLPRVGHRPFVIAGLSCVMFGFFGLAGVSSQTPFWRLYADLGLMGMGMGMAMLSLLLAVQASVPKSQLGIATSLGTFARSIGGAVGVAVMGAMVTASLPASGLVTPAALELGLHRAFTLGAGVSVLALIAGLFVPGGRPVGNRTTV
jgi:EmrB/QacA subfamily drug resistance transporter